jgi:hypothetical protein
MRTYDTVKTQRHVASLLVDNLLDGIMARNGEGFRKPKTGKRMNARDIKSPTQVERLLHTADPKANPLPDRRERSKRGKLKVAAADRFNASFKDYQERLAVYRAAEGVSQFAKKLPYPTWPASRFGPPIVY